MTPPEGEHSSGFIPVITRETRDSIHQDYNLDYFTLPESLRKDEPPGELLIANSKSVFQDLYSDEPKMVIAIFDALKKTNTSPEGTIYRFKVDAQTQGMALVLKCFQTQLGPDFFPNFSRLTDEDLEKAKQVISETLTPAGNDVMILETILSGPKIPEQQIDLNWLVKEISRYALHRDDFREGAATMYKVLANLWHKTTPPLNSPSDAI